MSRCVCLTVLIAAQLALPLATEAAADKSAVPDLAITGARVIDGDGKVRSDRTILIAGERITAILPGPPPDLPVLRVDAAGRTVIAGLIDAHVHLVPMDGAGGPDIESDATFARFLAEQLPARLADYLEHGVTTLVSVGDPWPEVLEVRRQLASGALRGPALLVTGPILTAPGGYPIPTICNANPWCRAHLTVEISDAAQARRVVSELAAAGVDAIKLVAGDARSAGLDDRLIGSIVQQAHAQGLPVLAHVTGVTAAARVVGLGVDILAHAPAGGRLDAGTVTTLVARGTAVLSTAGVYAPVIGNDGARRTLFGVPYGPPFDGLFADSQANLAVLAEHRVPVAFGSGTAMFVPSRSLAHEINTQSAVPLSGAAILAAATANAATAFGKAGEIGSIAVGKRADLVVVDGDPLTDVSALSRVKVVVQRGKIVFD